MLETDLAPWIYLGRQLFTFFGRNLKSSVKTFFSDFPRDSGVWDESKYITFEGLAGKEFTDEASSKFKIKNGRSGWVADFPSLIFVRKYSHIQISNNENKSQLSRAID